MDTSFVNSPNYKSHANGHLSKKAELRNFQLSQYDPTSLQKHSPSGVQRELPVPSLFLHHRGSHDIPHRDILLGENSMNTHTFDRHPIQPGEILEIEKQRFCSVE
jgi:hypothetical protein